MLKKTDSLLLTIYIFIVTCLLGYYTLITGDEWLLIFFLISVYVLIKNLFSYLIGNENYD